MRNLLAITALAALLAAGCSSDEYRGGTTDDNTYTGWGTTRSGSTGSVDYRPMGTTNTLGTATNSVGGSTSPGDTETESGSITNSPDLNKDSDNPNENK